VLWPRAIDRRPRELRRKWFAWIHADSARTGARGRTTGKLADSEATEPLGTGGTHPRDGGRNHLQAEQIREEFRKPILGATNKPNRCLTGWQGRSNQPTGID
jgi:hypothetical protein